MTTLSGSIVVIIGGSSREDPELLRGVALTG